MDYTTDCTTASSPFDEALSRPFLDSSDNYDDEDYSDGEEYGEQREAVTTKKWSLSKPSSWFRRSSSSSSKNDRNNNKALSSSSFKMTDLSKLPIDVVDDCESTSVTSDATLEEDDLISYAKKPTNIKSNQRRRSFDTMTTANSSGIFTTGTTTTNGRPESVSRVSSTSTTSTIMTCTLSHPLQDLMELDYDDDDDNRETTSLIQRQNEVVVFDMEAGTTLDPDTEIMKERQTELGNLAGSMRQIRDIQLGTYFLSPTLRLRRLLLSFLTLFLFSYTLHYCRSLLNRRFT